MEIILDMAISPNGLIAREDGSEDWLPEVSWVDFLAQTRRFNNIVMGRETYEQVTERYKDFNFDNVETDFKLIVSRDKAFRAPSGYTVVNSPEKAISFLESTGTKQLFLIGGGNLNTEFLKRKLVNEIQLTINPYILGKGRSFIAPGDFDLLLELVEHKLLSKGRIFVRYTVAAYQ